LYNDGILAIAGAVGGYSKSVFSDAFYYGKVIPGVGGGGVVAYVTTGFNFGGAPTYTLGGGIIFTYAPNNDKNAALSGRSATASAGTLTNSQALTQALSNASAQASAGTLTNSQALTRELSGAFVSAFAGDFGQNTDQVVDLASTSVAALAGTLTNSQESTRALSGVSANGQTSSFPAFFELVGAQASGQTGSLDYRNTGWQIINTDGSDIWTDINTQP
jgi:hypothetical protein